MIQHPIERHDLGVKFAHQILPDMVHAMLIVALVHFADICLLSTDFRQYIDVMVLPYVVEAMNAMGTHCGGWVTTSDRFRVSSS